MLQVYQSKQTGVDGVCGEGGDAEGLWSDSVEFPFQTLKQLVEDGEDPRCIFSLVNNYARSLRVISSRVLTDCFT